MAVLANKWGAPLLPPQDRSKLIEQRGAFCGEAAIQRRGSDGEARRTSRVQNGNLFRPAD